MTESIKAAIGETNRRRTRQTEWNEAHGITPESVKKGIGEAMSSVYEADYVTAPTVEGGPEHLVGHNLRATITELEERMKSAAGELEFEEAARLRDEVRRLEAFELGMTPDALADRSPGIPAAPKLHPGTAGSQRPRSTGGVKTGQHRRKRR